MLGSPRTHRPWKIKSASFGKWPSGAVRACMDAGLVKGEGFAVDASVMEADASRYRGKAPDEIHFAWAAAQEPKKM
jgi:hypothetical protein